jgi:glycosyltransferase involved in cell wall biosynthesis
MQHVIRSYLGVALDPWRVEVLPSYSSASRLRWLWRLTTAAVVLAFRPRARMRGIHLHASQRFDLPRTLVLLEIARLRRLPRIVTLHGSEFLTEVRRRPRLVRAMLRRADVVTVLSRDVEAAVRGLGAHSVVLLPNPIQLRAPAIDVSTRTQVLFAGEIGRRKGVDVLLEAWPAVHDAHPGISLLLVGPVADDRLIASLPAGARYGGVLSRDDVARALDDSCLAVLPSRAEAMPMFILEAMAAGVPVVATAVGAVTEMIGDGGVVVAADDGRALADALAGVLRDRAAIDELSRLAQRRIATEFSAERFERRVKDLYQRTFGDPDAVASRPT